MIYNLLLTDKYFYRYFTPNTEKNSTLKNMAGGLEVSRVLITVMTSNWEWKCIRLLLICCVFVAVIVNNEDKMPLRCIISAIRTHANGLLLHIPFSNDSRPGAKARGQQ